VFWPGNGDAFGHKRGLVLPKPCCAQDSIWNEVFSLTFDLVPAVEDFRPTRFRLARSRDGARRKKKKLRISHFSWVGNFLVLAVDGKQIALDWLTERVGQDSAKTWCDWLGVRHVPTERTGRNCLNNVLGSCRCPAAGAWECGERFVCLL
jgi:hypothetical protein